MPSRPNVAVEYPAKRIRVMIDNLGIDPLSPIACMFDIAVANGDADVTLLLPASIPGVGRLADILVDFGETGARPKPHSTVDAFLAERLRWDDLADRLGIEIGYPGELAPFRDLVSPEQRRFLHRHAARVDGAFKNGGAPIDPYAGLASLFSPPPVADTAADGASVGFLNGRAFEPADWPAKNLRENSKRIEAVILALIGGALWFAADERKGGIIVAGGCPSSGCIGSGTFDPATSDIDVFVCVPRLRYATLGGGGGRDHGGTRARADAFLESVIEALRKSCDGLIDVIHKPKTVDVRATLGRVTYKIQVIRVIYTSPAEVLWGFDLPACQLAYDGKTFVATDEAIHALSTGDLLFDETRKSTTGVQRLAKYAGRLKMRVQVPGTSQRLLDATRIFAIEVLLREAARSPDVCARLLALLERETQRYAETHGDLPAGIDVLSKEENGVPPSVHLLPSYTRPAQSIGVVGLAIELVRAEAKVPRSRSAGVRRQHAHDYDDDDDAVDFSKRVPVTRVYTPRVVNHWARMHPWILSADRKTFTGAFNPLSGPNYANHRDLEGVARLLRDALEP